MKLLSILLPLGLLLHATCAFKLQETEGAPVMSHNNVKESIAYDLYREASAREEEETPDQLNGGEEKFYSEPDNDSDSNPLVVIEDRCEPNPCQNSGRCSHEDPDGWGFSCFCPHPSGGRLCQHLDPCQSDPCPVNTTCQAAARHDRGRYCYDENWRYLSGL